MAFRKGPVPDLPSGTVTFLFTDIEGSTTLWERDRGAMAAAVARHIALLDAAIQAHGGIHSTTLGEAVEVGFPIAPSAVSAAVDAQRALGKSLASRSGITVLSWDIGEGALHSSG